MKIFHYLGKKFTGGVKSEPKEKPMNYLVPFQRKHNLTPDGVVGKNTLKKFREVYKLTDFQTAHFVAQISHESANFKYAYENLNYSQSGLRRVFYKYFPTAELRKMYARKPEKIANRVYANRMGNGDEQSGDGWKFRGRGSLQLTGTNNYKRFSDYMNIDFLSDPNKVAEEFYFEVAIFYFKLNNIFPKANSISYGSVKRVTKAINGGYHGLEQRYNKTKYFHRLLVS